MNNGVADPNAEHSDVPMESPEKLEKGKNKMPIEQDAMEDDEDESEEDEENEGEGEPEEPDEDNMEEIDMDNIVGTRTRGKNIDYAQAAKDLEGDDEEDEDDDDFEDEDDKMEV